MARTKKVDGNARSYGVFLTDEQRERIDILAFLRETTRSELIRNLVQETLDKNSKQIDAIIKAREEINNE